MAPLNKGRKYNTKDTVPISIPFCDWVNPSMPSSNQVLKPAKISFFKLTHLLFFTEYNLVVFCFGDFVSKQFQFFILFSWHVKGVKS